VLWIDVEACRTRLSSGRSATGSASTRWPGGRAERPPAPKVEWYGDHLLVVLREIRYPDPRNR